MAVVPYLVGMEPTTKALAKFAHLLPRGCRTWLDAYDLLGPEIDGHDDEAKIQYIIKDYRQESPEGILGMTKVTKGFILARVAEELLPLRLPRTAVYSMVGNSYKQMSPAPELLEFLYKMADAAPRRS